jgi:copper(I)-binding protein
MRSPFVLAAFLALAAAPAAAAALSVQDAWARPAAAGGTAAGYLTIVNRGGADVLVGADSPLVERVETHGSSMAGGVMRMAAEPAVPAPAGGRLVFAPGGRHLMLVGLKRPLKMGERVPVTLRFRSGARLAVQLVVQTAAPGGGARRAEHGHEAH